MNAPKTVICNIHEEIMSIAKRKMSELFKFRRSLNEEFCISDIDDFLSDIESSLDEIYTQAESAATSGVAMEARLRDYHDAIISLGFERKRS